MALFFSRRAFNAKTSKFTNNAAALTRYVEVTSQSGSVSNGNIIDRATWIDKVKAEATSRDILIYVHGFNNSQSDMLKRQRRIETGLRTHGYRGAVIAYDWPSDGNVLAYDADRRDAKRTAPFLVTEGIGLFLNETPRYNIHVVAHSMGAFLTLRGFSGVGDATGARPWGVEQVLFVAADVEAEWMRAGTWGGLVMERRAERLTNYYSTDDAVLKLAGKFIHGGRDRAGRKGLPDSIPNNHEDLRTTEQYRDKVPDGEKGAVLSHNWYYNDDGFLRDAALTVSGRAAQSMPTRRNANINDQILLT